MERKKYKRGINMKLVSNHYTRPLEILIICENKWLRWFILLTSVRSVELVDMMGCNMDPVLPVEVDS